MPRRVLTPRRGLRGPFDHRLVAAFRYHDGTRGLMPDEPCCRDVAEARRLWPAYRRAAWLGCPVDRSPGGAIYDDMRLQAPQTAHDHLGLLWHRDHVPEVEHAIRVAVTADRAVVAAFQRRDRAGARDIADVIDLILRRLDAIDVLVPDLLALAGDPGASYHRLWLAHVTGQNHGEAMDVTEPIYF